MRLNALPTVAGGLLLVASCAWGETPVPVAQSRGELLYSLHCIACHTQQIHWRDKHAVTDWRSLLAEVERWQANGHLGWDNVDVVETARYVNNLHYRFPVPEKP